MPVVSLKSTIAAGTADPAKARGGQYVAIDTIANALTDSVGSKYLLARLPSECILDERTQFKVDTWGYANIRIGTLTDPAALVSQTRATGTTVTPIVFGDAKHGLPLWQQLGMAADPGGEIGIYAHGLVAIPDVAGTMRFRLSHVFRY